jgi:membrane protein CcdC involved in cytochrome C biogenesis
MRRVYLTIFLVSCGVLIFEISLTRLFSIYLSHHFAFMVVSIAMLGIGSAGTILSLFTGLKNRAKLGFYAHCAGLSIFFSYLVVNHLSFVPEKLLWDKIQIVYIALYYILFSIPFFFAGALLVTVFSTESRKSNVIYCADLLGAGAGSLAVLMVLNISGPEYAVLLASTLCFIGSFIAGKKPLKYMNSVLIIANILFFALQPAFFQMQLSPYKNLSLALKYPGAVHLKTYHNSFSRIDTIRSPAVRFAPGLSLTYLEPLPEQIGMAVDGDDLNAVTEAVHRNKLAFIAFLPSSLGYEMIKQRDGDTAHSSALVIEPKGGLQTLTSAYYGFKTIHNVESNPLFTDVIKKDFGVFSGNILQKNTWSGLGRSWLTGRYAMIHGPPAYDIIDLSLTGTSVSSVFGMAEDYRFTVEAFREYFTRLKENGFISISLYTLPPPRTELRILTTISAMLGQSGIQDVAAHIAAIRSWDSMTILVKRSPLEKSDLRILKRFSSEKRFDVVHYPGIREEETNRYVKMPTDEYFQAFQRIMNPDTRELFLRDYIFDVSPVYDEKPFFHYFLKLDNIKVIYNVMGHKWQYFIKEGYLLPFIFLQVCFLSILLIVLPILFQKKEPLTQERNRKDFTRKNQPTNRPLSLSTLLYFALIGTGFMFVEVTMIQRNILVLENPAYAVATVLSAILISSGTGSLLSEKVYEARIASFLLIISGLIVVYVFLYPLVTHAVSRYSLALKIPLVFVSLIPLGFCMGVPFPAGMRALGADHETLIPWAWAINGCMSVLAPVVTIMLALTYGYTMILWLGVVSYIIAFFPLRTLIRG